MSTLLYRCWVVAKKDMLIYYFRGPVLIFGVLFPVCLFFAFAIGRGLPPHSLVPGLIGMSLFFAGSAVTPAVLPFETRGRTLERLLASPLTLSMILAGDAFAAFLFGLLVSAVPIGVALVVAGDALVSPTLLALTVLLSALCYAILGALFSVPPTDNTASIMTLANLVRLPTIFLSGVFVPIASMAPWARAVSAISPLTYTTELIRAAFGQQAFFPPVLSLATLTCFAALLWAITVVAHHHTVARRL